MVPWTAFSARLKRNPRTKACAWHRVRRRKKMLDNPTKNDKNPRMPINSNNLPKAKSKQEDLDMFRANSRRNSRLIESPTSTAKGKAIIPEGTYTPSNLSNEERRKQGILNARNTTASEGEALRNLGIDKDGNRLQPK